MKYVVTNLTQQHNHIKTIQKAVSYKLKNPIFAPKSKTLLLPWTLIRSKPKLFHSLQRSCNVVIYGIDDSPQNTPCNQCVQNAYNTNVAAKVFESI